MEPPQSTILIVEDEQRLADIFTTWLSAEYEVLTAYDGKAALSYLHRDIDAVLLDRRMPGMTGDEVLKELRHRGVEAPVGMVTAVEPDFDIIEMGFDDYVVKPVSRDGLFELVEELLSLSNYDDIIQRYFELTSKKVALEESKSEADLETSAEYAALLEEYEKVKSMADSEIGKLTDSDDFTKLF